MQHSFCYDGKQKLERLQEKLVGFLRGFREGIALSLFNMK